MGLYQQPTSIFDTDVRIYRPSAGILQLDTNSGAIPSEFDIVATSGQRSALGIKVAGDANYRTVIFGDATVVGLELGAGAATRDVSIRRASAGAITFDSNSAAAATLLLVQSTAGQRSAAKVQVAGDTSPRLTLNGDATLTGLELGPGNAVIDTTISRAGPGAVLLTGTGVAGFGTVGTGAVRSSISATIAGDSTTRAVLFGDATLCGLDLGSGSAVRDTNWYRGAANLWKTEDSIWLNSTGSIQFGTTQTPTIGSSATTKLEISGRLYLDAASAASAITDGALTYSSSGSGGLDYKSIEMGDGVQTKFVTPAGWQTAAFPVGLGSQHTFSVAMSLPINGGSVMALMLVIAPMKLSAYTIMNRDTSGAHTYEARLFLDTQNNSTTGLFVTGTDATFTFTPGAVGPVNSNGGTLNTTPKVIAPGLYWLIVRNTSASVAGNVGGLSSPADTLGAAVTDVGLLRTLATALSTAPTLHVAGGWTKTRGPGMALRGRVLGEAAIW